MFQMHIKRIFLVFGKLRGLFAIFVKIDETQNAHLNVVAPSLHKGVVL